MSIVSSMQAVAQIEDDIWQRQLLMDQWEFYRLTHRDNLSDAQAEATDSAIERFQEEICELSTQAEQLAKIIFKQATALTYYPF